MAIANIEAQLTEITATNKRLIKQTIRQHISNGNDHMKQAHKALDNHIMFEKGSKMANSYLKKMHSHVDKANKYFQHAHDLEKHI